MDLAEKYLKKFLDFNKMDRPLNNFVRTVQRGYNSSYRHAHPFIIQWNITPICNLRCKHCYYAGVPEIYQDNTGISLDRKLKLIDEIDALNVFHVVISGGEALLCDGIFDILKKLKSKNISIYMHSNGILIDKEMANKLASMLVPEVDTIQISLDGLKESHEYTRGKGTYDKAINAIKNLVQVGIPVSVNCTVTSHNLKDIVPLYNLVSELGVIKFSIEKLVPCSPAQESLVPSFEELLKMSSMLIDIENSKTFLELAIYKLKDFIDRNLATTFLIERSKHANSYVQDSSISCHKHSQLFITFDGDIFPCRDAYVCKELSLGNIKDVSLITAWQERNNNILFKERSLEELKNKNCPFLGICNGGCPLKSYIKTKRVDTTCTSCISLKKMHSV